jgi:hypothetical protein
VSRQRAPRTKTPDGWPAFPDRTHSGKPATVRAAPLRIREDTAPPPLWVGCEREGAPRCNGVAILARERNHSRLRHSSRNLPLKLSATPFCQGLPGSINAVQIPCATVHDSSALDTNSGPLSLRRTAGAPRSLTRLPEAPAKRIKSRPSEKLRCGPWRQRLKLLRELVPGANSCRVLFNPTNATTQCRCRPASKACQHSCLGRAARTALLAAIEKLAFRGRASFYCRLARVPCAGHTGRPVADPHVHP